MNQSKKFLRFFLGVPVTILSFLFIIKIFFDNRQMIIHSFASLNILLFLLGIGFFVLFFFIKSLIWIGILKIRGYSYDTRSTLLNYSLSEAKRYIPGSIFSVIGRLNTHSDILSKKETLKAIVIEATLLVVSAFITSIPALYYLLIKINSALITGVVCLVICILISLLVWLGNNKLKKTFYSYIPYLLLFIGAWILYAAACFFIAVSLTFLNPYYIIFILSIFTLSWLCGYLFFITPMGLGVREIALLFGLSSFTSVGLATAIAALTRLGMVVGELIYLVFLIFLKNVKNNSQLLKINVYFALVMTMSFVYIVALSTVSILRHNAYLSGRFDLGNMSQTVWNTAHGNIFQLTNPDGIDQISRLGIHSDFILVLFAPLYLLWSTPIVLLIVQSFSIALGGIFVYLIARKKLQKEKIAVILTASFFANFWIHEQNLFDFHAVTLATSALLGSFYFLIKKRYYLFCLMLLVAVLTKENVFLIAAIFGAYIFLKLNKKWGALLAIISIGIFYYLASYAIPHARGTEHFALSYYAYLGGTPKEILMNFFIKPQLFLSQIFSFSTLNYFHELLLPTGYLAILSPLYLIFALPDWAIYLLSNNQNLRMHYYHYGALIVPFIYISSIYSIKWLLVKFKNGITVTIIFYYLLTMLIVSCYLYSPLPGMKEADYRPFLGNDKDKVTEYLTLIPESASVSASNNLGAHLSHREKIYVEPQGLNSADYVALYKENKKIVNEVNGLLYETVVANVEMNFYIFKRITPIICPNCTP